MSENREVTTINVPTWMADRLAKQKRRGESYADVLERKLGWRSDE